jgi:hypothetical protein
MTEIYVIQKPEADHLPKEEAEAGPSGATDKAKEREKKFDEEGGDQPQAPSQRAVDRELQKIEEGKKRDHLR